MDFASSDLSPDRADAPLPASASQGLKIVIVGGFGVGKTTLVRSVSEIRPLDTEATMTQSSVGIDDLRAVREKSTTTVAFDFGRISIDDEHVLYLFGAPGQERFWFLWDRLFAGALGAIVLVDQRRIADSWYAIDRLENAGMPFIVACNNFGGAESTHPVGSASYHPPGMEDIRDALDLDPRVPLLDCDARSRESSKGVLITLVEHLYANREEHAI